MAEVGDTAPEITAPLVGDETTAFRLSEQFDSGPLILAFFPAAFSTTCTDELCTFRDDLGRFNDLGARILGISTDLPYALSRFREANDFGFSLVSDNDGSTIRAYDVVEDWPHISLSMVAQRAVFVIDTAGTIQYVWRADTPSDEPPYEEVAEAVKSLQ